ncbi:hypothetical protein [Desulfovibrio sp. UIB00]|uniref:hypothetical protein n=1 Tax=Desulfovibrio sp. UIB00 TaxID=2804314 RepID=UPI001F0E8213|nr:hypothetical protein [Desulfovibrio sp. UIB00]
MRQRRDFDAHVHEYAALKIPALTHSGRKTRILQIHSTPAIASLRSGEFKEGNATTSSLWRLKLLTHKLSAYVGLNKSG